MTDLQFHPYTPPDHPAEQEPIRQTPIAGISPMTVREYGSNEHLAGEVLAATGCQDPDAGAALIEKVTNASPAACQRRAEGRQEPDHQAAYDVRQVMAELRGRSGVEALLAAQATATHLTAINMLQVANEGAATGQPNLAAIRTAERLLRLSKDQLLALDRTRSGARQTIRVENVTVSDGGQAVVGSVGGEVGR